MNLKNYLKRNHISSRQAIDAISAVFPKYTKVAHCMVVNPEYGVRLSPEAERIIKDLVPKRPAPKRRKRNRLVVRLDDVEYSRVKETMAYWECNTAQDFLSLAVAQMPMPERMEEDG